MTRLTLQMDASSSCVIPFAFLSAMIFSDNFIAVPPHWFVLYTIMTLYATNMEVLFGNLRLRMEIHDFALFGYYSRKQMSRKRIQSHKTP